MKDYQRRAKNKYREKIEELRVELYPTDEDIKKRLAEQREAGVPKATYIKRLIREDMQRDIYLKQYENLAISARVNDKGEIIDVSLIKKCGD